MMTRRNSTLMQKTAAYLFPPHSRESSEPLSLSRDLLALLAFNDTDDGGNLREGEIPRVVLRNQ
jgi:hypothetical protein